MNDASPAPNSPSGPHRGVRTYALAPHVRARLMGSALVAIAVLLVVMTVVVAALRLPQDILSLLVLLVVVAVFGLGFLLVRKWYVVRLDDQGYRVRFVRGVGTAHARWVDVLDLGTATQAGDDVVVLRLRDGGTTTVPVGFLEGDQEEFVEELRRRLEPGATPRRRR